MTGFIVILSTGIFIGWFIRGAFSKSRIGHLKNMMREEQLHTQIESERMKQHRMLDERINT